MNPYVFSKTTIYFSFELEDAFTDASKVSFCHLNQLHICK